MQRLTPFGRFLPFFTFLDNMGTADQFDLTLVLVMVSGCAITFFSPWVRTGCLLAGGSMLLGLLACQPCQSVAHTYLGCLFLVIGFSNIHTGVRPLQLQVVILYAGSALHKLIDVDWWNGNYFETLMIDRHDINLYKIFAAHLSDRMLSVIMGVATLIIEVFLALAFYYRRLHAEGLIMGVLFHSVMVLMMRSSFGPFYSALMISFLAFLPWPDRVMIRGRSAIRPFLRIFPGTDPNKKYEFRDDRDLSVEAGGIRSGFLASMAILCTHPVVLFFAAAGLARGPFKGKLIILLVVAGGLSWAIYRFHPLMKRNPVPARS